MFGFSFPKLAALIAIVAAVWYVFKATDDVRPTLGSRRNS